MATVGVDGSSKIQILLEINDTTCKHIVYERVCERACVCACVTMLTGPCMCMKPTKVQ